MPRLVRRLVSVLDSILILSGVVFFVLGVADGIAWILSSGLGSPSSNPTFLLDQRMRDKLASQAVIWIPAGLLLILGGTCMWSYLSRGEGERIPPPPPSRGIRIAPVALLLGFVFLLLSVAVASVPLPRRTLVFADQDFPFTGTDYGGSIRVSAAFAATAGDILTGTFRETYTDILTGDFLSRVVLNSSVSVVSDTYPMPSSPSWEYSVMRNDAYVVIVGGNLGVCPASLGCPENYTSQISGHVTVTGPAPYPVEGALLLVPGVALAVPPVIFWRVKFRKKPEAATR